MGLFYDRTGMKIDASLAHRLVALQFPEWADLPIQPVAFDGWDNRTFHLGDRMALRLPSAAQYSLQVEKEQRWLPKLALHLPLQVPIPLAMGEPTEDYPWHWSIYQWIDGETATVERIADLQEFAVTLAEFIVALHRIDATGGPPAGTHNFFRGGPLKIYDAETRQAIAVLDGKIDTHSVTAIWEEALTTTWEGKPVWVHGDISPGNLLVENGKLTAVIDFGSSAVGDPSCDLSIAWTLFDRESRDRFRKTLALDDATWARARGWTLWKALIVLAGLCETNALDDERSQRVIDAVLA